MLARGHVALENQTSANSNKQRRDIMENQAKVETINTLEHNSYVNAKRTDYQQKVAEQKRRMQLDMITKQMSEKKDER